MFAHTGGYTEGGERQVEDAVSRGRPARSFEAPDAFAERTKHVRPRRILVRPALVEAAREERVHGLGGALQVLADALAKARVVQVRARVPDHHGSLRHVVVQEQREQRGVGFLLGEIARAPEHGDRQAHGRVGPVRLVRITRRHLEHDAGDTNARSVVRAPPRLPNARC